MVFIKILLQQYKEKLMEQNLKVLLVVILMVLMWVQVVQLKVLIVVFKQLELLVIMGFLNMEFIKSLEVYKEVIQVLFNRVEVLYMVLLMEYNLMVLLKVIIQLTVMVFI